MDFKFVPQQYPRYSDIDPEKLAGVIYLSAAQRYEHFIKEISGQNQVCGLCKSDQWALTTLEDGTAAFLLWPAATYAEFFLCPPEDYVEEFGEVNEHYEYDDDAGGYFHKELGGFTPRFIELDEFMNTLLPLLKQENILPGVFFTPFENGVTPPVEELHTAIHNYYQEWFSDEPREGVWETKKFNDWCRKVESL
ncbi:MAG: DUF2750 domain-containing protein [Sulfuriferula sp.]